MARRRENSKRRGLPSGWIFEESMEERIMREVGRCRG